MKDNPEKSSDRGAVGPDFVCVGAQKAGTTWLQERLKEHPEVWVPPRKELHYFDRDSRYPTPNLLATSSLWRRIAGSAPWERPRMLRECGVLVEKALRLRIREVAWRMKWTFGNHRDSWYLGLFEQGAGYAVRGEVTPDYSILEEADVRAMKTLCPDLRIILLLRDPVERVWSQIRFNNRIGVTDVRLDDVSELLGKLKPDGSVIGRSRYRDIIDRFARFFPCDRILVGFYESVSADPQGLMNEVAKFLGVGAHEYPAARVGARANATAASEMPPEVGDKLREMLADTVSWTRETFGGYAETWVGEAVGEGARAAVPLSETVYSPRGEN